VTRIWSFDVFDTLLGRSVNDRGQIFCQAALQVEKLDTLPFSPAVYASERARAEKRLVEQGLYPTLNEIGKELARASKIPSRVMDGLIAIELEIERMGFWPISENLELLRQKRTSGKQIVFVTDTYFSSTFILEILSKLGISQDGEPVFASCEYGAGKKTGALFARAAEALGVPCGEISHYGDNRLADLVGAKKAGVNGNLTTKGHLNKYEATIRRFADRYPIDLQTKIYLSQIGGALRRVRLENRSALAEHFHVAAGVAGPVLYWFVRRTLIWAKENDVRRLYFVSRDGNILYRIAHIIAAGRSDAPSFHYLRISRAAALLACVNRVADADQLRSVVLALRPCSLREFINYVMPSDSLLSRAYLPEELDKSITDLPIGRVIQPLLDVPEYYREFFEHNEPRRQRFHAFLNQEGLITATESVALVDVGWRLTIHDLIASVTVDSGGSPPMGYYFGIDNVGTDATFGKKEAYMWDARGCPRWPHIEYITRVIEVFCSADEPRTMDYNSIDGAIVPVARHDDEGAYASWGLDEVRSGILLACEALNEIQPVPDGEKYKRLLSRELIAKFWCEPTTDEVMSWGPFPFETSGTEDEHVTPLYVDKGLWSKSLFALRHGSLRGDERNSWTGATRRMTSRPAMLILRALVRLRRLIDWNSSH